MFLNIDGYTEEHNTYSHEHLKGWNDLLNCVRWSDNDMLDKSGSRAESSSTKFPDTTAGEGQSSDLCALLMR